MRNAIPAKDGWSVISAVKSSQNQPNTIHDFNVEKYPLIAWLVDDERATPITTFSQSKNAFRASVSPNGDIYSNCTNKRVFKSVDDWLSDILTTYAGRL